MFYFDFKGGLRKIPQSEPQKCRRGMMDGTACTLYRTMAGHLRDARDSGSAIRLDGGFLPSNSPEFTRAVLDDFARVRGLPTWESFRVLHTSGEPIKPTKPTDERLDFKVREKGYYGEKAVLYREYLRRAEWDDYISAYEIYEKEVERRNRVVQNFPLCASGYVSFFCDANPEFHRFFFDQYRTLPIAEQNRERHTYITGGTGSGKTEAIKVLAHHYIARNKTAVVIIEPHGDLALQVAQWREFRDDPDRLVYIDPAIDTDTVTPVFNPLDIPDEERTPLSVNTTAIEIVEVFREILSGVEFSKQMETLLRACIATLLLRKGSTFRDLLRFLDDEQNADLLAFAKSHLRDDLELFRIFLTNDFQKDSFNPTKQSIKMRLYSFLPGFFERVTVGKSSFDFEGALKARKVVVFNLSKTKLGEAESALLGRFILARLKSFAFEQGRIPNENRRVPVHVFIDECQNYITDSVGTILREARKYRVHLTLAQQVLGDGMDTQTIRAILSNTAVKITGRNARHTLDIIAKETDAPVEELNDLGVGEFHIKSGGRKSVRVRMPAYLLKNKGAMSAQEWETVQSAQIARYYRPLTRSKTTGKPDSSETPVSREEFFGFKINE